MEVTGEISDTDSGIILHSGSDSPTTHGKDVTTHTRAMKLKHQVLQDQLEKCLLELKDLCIREAKLTGQLPKDYPLSPGEKPPKVPRRIGAAFKLEVENIPRKSEDSELSSANAALALQMKIYEAARKLCEDVHLGMNVKKSRIHQCKLEKKKLEQLQEKVFRLRLEHGRTSPHPAFLTTQQDLGASDDSSLSDSVGQDEEVTRQTSQPSSVLPYPVETQPPQPPPLLTHSSIDGSYMSRSPVPRSPQLNPCQSPCPSIDSKLSLNSNPKFDPPPIKHSPWTESSLDQPYQKSKKSRSSIKASPAKSEVLPPLEACLPQATLPQQLSNMNLSRTLSTSTPSTPEMRVHRQLSLRLPNPESPFHKDHGHSRGPRRRLTECRIVLPESMSPTTNYGNHVSSEDSNSEKSFSSYSSSPSQEFPLNLPRQHHAAFMLSSSNGSYQPPAFRPANSFRNPRHVASPIIQRTYHPEEMVYPPDMDVSHYHKQTAWTPNRYEYFCRQAGAVPQRVQRLYPPDIILSPPLMDPQQYCQNVLPRQVVDEELKSWKRRSQLRTPRSRSLDRQGAVRLKNPPARESASYQNQKYHDQVNRPAQRATEDAQTHWLMDDGSHYMSQV